ncbi:putative HECT domain, Ubiquitin-like domain, Ubiquitin-like domain superfamily [Helianthus annuus]|uniref:HECT-type E3 ubiquitin transferase n=1 Tax=Helianthus annuus TaxID=4232 RepID=A0A251UL14_HELAN|nr:E3 ubiquitin-protein ligase UPL5 [Helianthus annuus]KAF5804069.1 putative HECT domain, Ubiquitin domain, Ubiquitin-like domain superfamily [Helianthus annuus]KAJ0917139.1 putative HECT domain, Ubiquitin-like domain, Ubiquitin-like domain superfamily [Helianthus annuus]
MTLAEQQRIKRKLDDYVDDDLDLASSSSSSFVRMRKDDRNPNPQPQPQNPIQFFVRTISGGTTLVLRGYPHDTIELIHRKIHSATGIPIMDQRLIYCGKQLQSEHTLSHYRITNDAGLHLVARMRSTGHPLVWQLVDDLVSVICRACRGVVGQGASTSIKLKLTEFLNMLPTTDDHDHDDDHDHNHNHNHRDRSAAPYLDIFLSSSAPAALVMLYFSPHPGNKECALDSVQHFIKSLPRLIYSQFAPILLDFCKLLRRAAFHDDPLYKLCRTSLASMVHYINLATRNSNASSYNNMAIALPDIFPFMNELATKLSQDLVSSMESVSNSGPSSSDVHDFGAFLQPLRSAIIGHGTPLPVENSHNPWYSDEVGCLYTIFLDLLGKVQACLNRVEEHMKVRKEKGDGGWDQYLCILKELHHIAVLYQGAEDKFWMSLRCNKVSMCYLIVRYAKRGEDHKWILEHKELTDFASRRHLVMMLLPEVKDEYEELHEMLIDRSQLLAESFEYISGAEPGALRSGLFMEFKNEEATGPGVLREWFFLVCQAIFDPQNALFLVCPNDRRRFFPNPASKVDPMHLRYFKFAGRVIALALMHKMQVGIVFDRAFFLQLGGVDVCLEDIKDADPYLYSSCKQILDMDARAVDEDALGLTFVWEAEELGSMKLLELVPDGKLISVNSRNRKEYVDLLVKHRFVTSVAQQVTEFARGFTDIVTSEEIRKLCFKSLLLEDLDGMLHGSESPISVEDWKAHTEYNGYKCTDPQIKWFWKIVGEMTAEQRKVLLFFWTSVKYLPVEGFCGLASRLYIYKSGEGDRLPSSHTCFFRICFPAYPSMAVMQQRLNIITQQHVACSFGTW